MDLKSVIEFTPEYRDINALKCLDEFSHIWLIWHFSLSKTSDKWSPTVRPPRLGGNKRVGVFASRAPYRPNPLGLSCVKLEEIKVTENGPILIVSGADLADGTPIFDIKPYIPFVDCVNDAREGYTANTKKYEIKVSVSDELLEKIPSDKRDSLIEILSEDPRPAYHDDPKRIYGFNFSGYEIHFSVDSGILTVRNVEKNQ